MTYDRPPRAVVQATPTTLSGLARSGQTQTAPRWSRGRVALNIAAVALGGALGTMLALREPASSALSGPPDEAAAPGPASTSGASPPVEDRKSPDSPSPSTSPAAPAPVPAAAAQAKAVASPTPAAPASDRHAAVVAQIEQALSRFVAWSRGHAGARCPDAAALGVAELDPWGQPLRIVCADQPADQIAGVLSFGPDGVPGTRDDVTSWTLGPEVTELARGPRWTASRRSVPRSTAPAAPEATPPAARSTVKPPAGTRAGSNDTDGEGIPNRR